jgi:hypothetical protein
MAIDWRKDMTLKGSFAFILGLGLAAGVLSGVVLSNWSKIAYAESVAAQSRVDPRRETGRWEYCAISRSGVSASLPRGNYAVSYFRATGVETTYVEETATDRSALSRTIAKLGDDGWEMIGQGPIEFKPPIGGEALYFKRRR